MKKEKLKLEVILFRSYIIITILEGLIRYLLSLVGLEILIYIKDLIIMVIFLLSLKQLKLSKTHIIGFAVISVSFITSLIYIYNIKQILFFVLKVLLIFLVGVLQYKNIINDFINNIKFYKLCYMIIIFGVILNNFVTLPWEGLSYSFGDVTINA